MPRIVPPAPVSSLRSSGDRWLFGYADVVTLLFACFAALYAHAAPQAPGVAVPPPDVLPAAAVPPAKPALADEIARLAALEPDVRVELSPSASGTVISLAETGSFPVGTADLTPAALRVLGQIAGVLRQEPFDIRVEGHTDDRPIRTARYASNWELSAARATRVVQFFVEQGGVSPVRLSAAGYGEFRPRLKNDTAEARARNRRVDIVVFDTPPVQARSSGADYPDVGTRVPGGK